MFYSYAEVVKLVLSYQHQAREEGIVLLRRDNSAPGITNNKGMPSTMFEKCLPFEIGRAHV